METDEPTSLARLLGIAAVGASAPAVPVVSPLLPVRPRPSAATRVEPAPTGPRGTVVACFSPKGGVGKTTVSLLLAGALAQRGRHLDGERVRACVVDLDLFGDVAARLGRAAPTILDLARTSPTLTAEEVDAVLVVDRSTGLRALLAPPVPDARARALLTPAFHRRIVDVLAAAHDVVVLDCGTELTDPLLATYAIPAADRLVFVVNNEVATLAAARAALELIIGPRLGFDPDRIVPVLNQRAGGVGLDEGDVLARLPQVRRIAARFPDDRVLFVGAANRARPIVSSADPEVEAGIADLVHATVPGIRLSPVDVVRRAVVPAAAPTRPDLRSLARLLAGRWLHRAIG